MSPNDRQRAQLRALCEELREDDGVDPRKFFKSQRNRNSDSRKVRQLCRQVQRTLDLVLSGETADPTLCGLRVASVGPGADPSRLLITVVADVAPEAFDRALIEARLAAMAGRLRTEVASTISRRKTPALSFQVLGPGGDPSPEEGV